MRGISVEHNGRALSKQSTIVLNFLSDAARANGGYRVRVSAKDISNGTGIMQRRVYAALRDLRERELIEVERIETRYGHEPNTYILLPAGKGRIEKVDRVAQLLGIPRAEAAELLQRLWSVRDTAGTLSLAAFSKRAGWTGDPQSFASALVETGMLQNGRLVW